MDETTIIEKFDNLMNRDYLRETLCFFALYITIYENLIETVVTRVESFLCFEIDRIQNGHIKYIHSDIYKEEIRNKIVDGKGNKDIIKATMLWFQENKAITQDEYNLFLELKDLRNSFVHDLADHVWHGVSDKDIQALSSLFAISAKLDNWWINEIDIPIMGKYDLNEEESKRVFSLNLLIFGQMIQTLFGNETGYKKSESQ
ncbi:MAG TPA: hypothetical protein PK941_10925 [Paludibacter sp.]|nr:hypothetical protein [Paludibacter sp.]